MTECQKGMLVLNYLLDLGLSPAEAIEAIGDEKRDESYKVIKANPQITRTEFLQLMQIEEN